LGHRGLHAEGLVIDLLAALPDQDICARDLACRRLVLEELGYLRKLVLIEMRSGGNIEGAFGVDRRRGRQHQRATGECTQQQIRIHWTPSGIRRECNPRVSPHKGCRSVQYLFVQHVSRVNCCLSMVHLLLHKTTNSVSSEPGADHKWIAQAERWHELERAQASWRKQKRPLQQSMHAGPMTTQQRQLG